MLHAVHAFVGDLSLLAAFRIPLPVTTNMFAVLLIGGAVTWVLSKLPGRLSTLAGIAALGTVGLVLIVGYDDVTGGDIVNHVANSQCVGWSPYVDKVESVQTQYETILDRLDVDVLSTSDAIALANEARGLMDQLNQGSPPEAATALHQNLYSTLAETQRQLRSYASGGDFDPAAINALIDRHSSLITALNAKCA
ncbi:MAG: hypothetical protein QM692_10105 [Thermomicrobiales bacterium]